jgi:hypothetical protein
MADRTRQRRQREKRRRDVEIAAALWRRLKVRAETLTLQPPVRRPKIAASCR